MLFRFRIHNTKQVFSTQKKDNGFSNESNCFEKNLIREKLYKQKKTQHLSLAGLYHQSEESCQTRKMT